MQALRFNVYALFYKNKDNCIMFDNRGMFLAFKDNLSCEKVRAMFNKQQPHQKKFLVKRIGKMFFSKSVKKDLSCARATTKSAIR